MTPKAAVLKPDRAFAAAPGPACGDACFTRGIPAESGRGAFRPGDPEAAASRGAGVVPVPGLRPARPGPRGCEES